MRALFVCSQNKLRSPTAEDTFASWEGIEVASAGTDNDAVTPLSGDLIEWADVIFVMERTHQAKMTRKFNDLLRGKKIAHSAHRDHPDRRIVITSIVHRDRESERSDEQAVQAVA